MMEKTYNCKLHKFRLIWTLTGALSAIAIPYLLYYFGVTDNEQWWTFSIGALVALAFAHLLSNTKVEIRILDRNVIIYHAGMVQSNFPKNTVSRVRAIGDGHNRQIEILTTDGLKFCVPVACFNEEEIGKIISNLKICD